MLRIIHSFYICAILYTIISYESFLAETYNHHIHAAPTHP